MNLEQFLLALRARFGVFSIVVIATIAAAVVTSLLLPKSYKATVSLLVDAKEEQSLSNGLRPALLPQEKIGYLQTQVDILTSKGVARKVVQDLKLADRPAVREAYEKRSGEDQSIEDWLVESLLTNLKVDTSQSNVIQVSFTSADPQVAASVANAFSKSYVETMLELRVAPTREAAAWFNEQLKSLRASLEGAQAALSDYRRQRGIVTDDERADIDNNRLAILSEEASRAQADTFQWTTRARQARELLEQGELDRLPEILENSFVQKLKSDLLAGEAKLRELSAQYGSNYPPYQQQVAENRSLRERLNAEMRKVQLGIEASARRSQQREAELRGAMAGQRARVLDLRDNRNELAVLKRNVESATQAYDTAMQRFVVSQVESRANQTNVTVLNAAVPPGRPFRPNLLLNVALSLVVGTILGVGTVMLSEMRDRRIRSRRDLELDVPLLVELNAWRGSPNRLLGGPSTPRSALPKPG